MYRDKYSSDIRDNIVLEEILNPKEQKLSFFWLKSQIISSYSKTICEFRTLFYITSRRSILIFYYLCTLTNDTRQWWPNSIDIMQFIMKWTFVYRIQTNESTLYYSDDLLCKIDWRQISSQNNWPSRQRHWRHGLG